MAFSAYAGNMEPAEYPWAGIVAMTFPATFFAAFVMLCLDIFFFRKILFIPVLAFAACLPSVLEFFPLNACSPTLSEEEKEKEFTLLTYNLYNFAPYGKDSVAAPQNPYISFILEQNPDIVCLQEATRGMPNSKVAITPAQTDSILERYPYVIFSSAEMAMFSKFPAKVVPFIFRDHCKEGNVVGYHLDIHGTTVSLFNVHLKSIGLTDDDKQLYTDLTDFKNEGRGLRQELSEAKHSLIAKLCAANVVRAENARLLLDMIAKFGGENVMVVGDFNDTPGCYTLRSLEDAGLKQVYPKVAFGPMITYHENKFYFRIDHVLYRGDLKPVSLEKGKINISDHYPLIVKFTIKDTEKK